MVLRQRHDRRRVGSESEDTPAMGARPRRHARVDERDGSRNASHGDERPAPAASVLGQHGHSGGGFPAR